MDNHSKWIEVVPMKSTTTVKTLEVLRSLFARYGLPKQLVSDNGPQFTSQEFEECMRVNGIRHIKSAPYHPASNGEAERFVQTFKRSLQAGRKENGTVPQKLAQFLLSYRSTPNATTGVTPAELFLKRKIRTRLDLLKPSVEDYVHEQQMKQKQYHDNHSCQRSYHVGQAVLVRNHRDGANWIVGRVIEKLGPVTYEVEVDGRVLKRHINQLMEYKGIQIPLTESPSVPNTEELIPEPVTSAPVVPRPDPEPTERSSPMEDVSVTPSPPTMESPAMEVADTRLTPSTPAVPKVYPHRHRKPPDRFEPTM